MKVIEGMAVERPGLALQIKRFDAMLHRAEQAEARLREVVEALERYRDIPDGVDGSWTAANTLAAVAAAKPMGE